MSKCKTPTDQTECIVNIYPEYIITNECRYCELFDWEEYWNPSNRLQENNDINLPLGEKSIWMRSKMKDRY